MSELSPALEHLHVVFAQAYEPDYIASIQSSSSEHIRSVDNAYKQFLIDDKSLDAFTTHPDIRLGTGNLNSDRIVFGAWSKKPNGDYSITTAVSVFNKPDTFFAGDGYVNITEAEHNRFNSELFLKYISEQGLADSVHVRLFVAINNSLSKEGYRASAKVLNPEGARSIYHCLHLVHPTREPLVIALADEGCKIAEQNNYGTGPYSPDFIQRSYIDWLSNQTVGSVN